LLLGSLALGTVLLVLLVGTSLLSIPLGWSQTRFDSEIEESRTQLEALRQQAVEKRRRAREYAQQEKGVLDRLGKAEEALAATRQYIHKLESRQGELQDQIRQTLVDLSWAQDELTTRRGELGRRLRHSYMYNKTRALEVVFSADSFPNLLQRTAFLNRVLQQDKKLIDLVEKRELEVRDKLTRLEEQRIELELLQAEKADEEERYLAMKQERAKDLASVRDQKSLNEEAARELDEAAQRLEQVLGDLERKRRGDLSRNNRVLTELDRRNFGANQGRLPWPVKGKVITKFGRQKHPKYKTETISNGVDIAAEEGTPVKGVGDGVVDLAKWLPGYGQTVILNHGRGYYSVYGHLSSIAVRPNELVKPGQVLGTVGDTGSLKGTCLHFEVRQGGTAKDPLIWLR
jgi:septal ring factor EnvC (AmiA/AmiB activator)